MMPSVPVRRTLASFSSKARRPTVGDGGNSRLARPHNNSSYTGGSGTIPPKNIAVDTAKVIENERWKYLATFLNTVAAACIAIGILTPLSGILSKGFAEAPPIDVLTTGGYVTMWIAFAGGFHVGASLTLGNLKP